MVAAVSIVLSARSVPLHLHHIVLPATSHSQHGNHSPGCAHAITRPARRASVPAAVFVRGTCARVLPQCIAHHLNDTFALTLVTVFELAWFIVCTAIIRRWSRGCCERRPVCGPAQMAQIATWTAAGGAMLCPLHLHMAAIAKAAVAAAALAARIATAVSSSQWVGTLQRACQWAVMLLQRAWKVLLLQLAHMVLILQ